jgi:hypothetical protein
VHVVLLLVLAMIGQAAVNHEPPRFRADLSPYDVRDFATLEQTEIAEIDQAAITPVGGSFAPETSAFLSEKYAVSASGPLATIEASPVKVAPELKATSMQPCKFEEMAQSTLKTSKAPLIELPLRYYASLNRVKPW